MKSGNSQSRYAVVGGSESPSIWMRALTAWNNFWFAPQDPTVLGLIRIGCGLLALYTLVAYTADLQDLFGKHAWMDLKLRMESVREAPWAVGPLNWAKPRPEPVANNPRQKEYIRDYKKKWGENPPLPWPKSEKEAEEIDQFRLKWGGDPRDAVAIGAPIWSLWFHVTDPTVMYCLHWLFILITFLFTIGFGTRVTSVLTWFVTLCYLHRSPATLFGVDTMMLVTMMYLMIGPAGAALSVDRLIGWWRRRHLGGAGVPPALGGRDARTAIGVWPAPTVSANLAIRLLQVHMCFIYAAAGLAKLKGSSWWRGDAIWGTLANSEFAPMQSSLYMNVLYILAANQFIFKVFLAAGTWFTLFFEIGYPTLVWNRYTRWLMLFMALVLHGFIGMLMGLRTFAFMMLVMNMVFLPIPVVHWIVGRLRSAALWIVGLFLGPQRPTAEDKRQRIGGAAKLPESHLRESGHKLRIKRGSKSRRKRSET